jgi:uncharacterized HAD superfamily protein
MTAIYIDMDDVLTESYLTFLNVLEKNFDKKMNYSQITTFDLQKSFGLSDNEYTRFFELIHDPDEMIQHVPVPGAKKMLKLWRDSGHNISILTGRPLETRSVSLEWLDLHDFEHDSFSIVNKYGRDSSTGGMSMSLETLSQLPFDLAVEDSGNMAQFLSEQMDVKVALLDRPWNRSMVFNDNVQRCADWTQIKEKFERL